jgi:heat shock protein HslJ
LDNTVTNTPIAVYLTLGRIVGSMQCANFEGSYVVKDNEINFHNITLVATGACSTVNYLEQTFISSLKNAERFVMDNVNRKLSIYSPIGSQSIVLRY